MNTYIRTSFGVVTLVFFFTLLGWGGPKNASAMGALQGLPTSLNGSSASPPAQPESGPGGANYLYSGVTSQSYGEGAEAYEIFEPLCCDCGQTLPVIVFLHGWSATFTEGYEGWIEHLVRRGNILIFPKYQGNMIGRPFSFTESMVTAVKDAMQKLEVGWSHNFAPDWDKVAAVGHSMGGVLAANLAAISETDPELPRFKAVMVVAAGGMQFTRRYDYSNISPETLLLCVVGEEDGFQEDSRHIFDSALQVNPENKDFITVLSDHYGGNGLTADHYAPASLKMFMTNALDYFGYWKWFDGLCDAAFYGMNREYALGETPQQCFMGHWSDGTPVKNPLVTDTP